MEYFYCYSLYQKRYQIMCTVLIRCLIFFSPQWVVFQDEVLSQFYLSFHINLFSNLLESQSQNFGHFWQSSERPEKLRLTLTYQTK